MRAASGRMRCHELNVPPGPLPWAWRAVFLLADWALRQRLILNVRSTAELVRCPRGRIPGARCRGAQRRLVVVALSLALCGLALVSASAGTALRVLSPVEKSTAYTNIVLTLFQTPFVGGGGALATNGSELIIASSDGMFFSFDGNEISENRLPRLDLGRDGFKSQTSYSYVEKLPRVHGIAADGKDACVAYDEYLLSIKRIVFSVACTSLDHSAPWQKLYSSPPLDAHYYAMGAGGKIILREGKLIVTVGDYSLDRVNNLDSDFAAQNPSLPFGKVIELSRSSPGTYRVLALGLRNPQGLAIVDGEVMISDHGPRGGDRLIKLKEGANYGWPLFTLGTGYTSYGTVISNSPEESVCGHDRDQRWQRYAFTILPTVLPCPTYQEGLYAFVPSIAPTALIQTRNFFKGWDGDILLASLKAQTLYRIRVKADRVLFAEPIPVGHRIRDLVEWHSAVWLFLDDGSLLKLVRSEGGFASAAIPGPLLRCVGCHVMDSRDARTEKMGPELTGVYGRKIGGTAYGYSLGLKGLVDESWTGDNLAKFLRNTASFAPGTTMPELPDSLTDQDISDIIGALKRVEGAAVAPSP